MIPEMIFNEMNRVARFGTGLEVPLIIVAEHHLA
jgi:hypothetical protein